MDNREWSICRPPTIEFNNDAENRELDYIDLGSGIAMYAVNNGLQHLPEHLKNYLNDTDYHHCKTDRYAGSIRANGKSYLVYVPAHVHCNEPILLSASLLGCAMINMYVVVGSSAMVSFTYDQSSCATITMHLEPYAQVSWKHCNEHLLDDGYTFIACYQQQESRLIFNGWYTRTTYNNMFFILREPKAHVEVALGLHAQDAHHAWFNTTQIHQAAQTMSNVILKGLLAASSRSVHRGMIHIEENAQRSDARLTSRYLLLHNDAQAYAVPSLEVLTNDVTCAHGSSIGSCDDAHLFYLMSRGIALNDCYQLLTDAFFADLSY